MNILVCTKIVLDEEELKFSNGELDQTSNLKISNFDLSAIECALSIKEKNADCKIIGVYAGESLNSKLSKDLLSRGLDELINLKGVAVDSISAANAVCEYAKSIDAKIIIAGSNSSDLFQGIFAPFLAAKLDAAYAGNVSAINAVSNIVDLNTSDSLNESHLNLDLPAVLSVNPEYYEAKIPGMKAILQAAKKPCSEVAASNNVSKITTLKIEAPKSKNRAKQIFELKDFENFKSEFEKLL
ncbi:hypothetical protein AVBRAN12642_03780 [Campylobacter sp. RM12642]|uniref:hypothetical protein n=1 Tax=Campylobacter sp. RM12642 TaxID=2735736 RepID=UPI0030155010|nr:hypothetical protein [Campylobacter sp. RM12642]